MTRFDWWFVIIALSIIFFVAQDRYCDYLNKKQYDWPRWIYKIDERDIYKPAPFQRYKYYVIIDRKRHDIKQNKKFIYKGKEFYENGPIE